MRQICSAVYPCNLEAQAQHPCKLSEKPPLTQSKQPTIDPGSPLYRRSLNLLLLSTCLFASLGANNSSAEPSMLTEMENILVFTDGGSLVTLTNNHHLLPTTCLFKGRSSANRKASETAPIDPVTAMIWYIETSRQHQANYLLANARYESLWAYQCTSQKSFASQAVE